MLGAHRDSASLHKVDIFHLTALIIDDGFGGKHLLSQHKSQTFYCASWQALELWHLHMGSARYKHVCIAQPDALSVVRLWILPVPVDVVARGRSLSHEQSNAYMAAHDACNTRLMQYSNSSGTDTGIGAGQCNVHRLNGGWHQAFEDACVCKACLTQNLHLALMGPLLQRTQDALEIFDIDSEDLSSLSAVAGSSALPLPLNQH